jgi:hypothetical protein
LNVEKGDLLEMADNTSSHFFSMLCVCRKCSYIQTLLPLPNYTLALHDAVSSALGSKASSASSSLHSSSWQAELYRASNPGNIGLGRFAAEHWIASHPHVQPCDLSESNRISDYWTASLTTAATKRSSETQQQEQRMMLEHQHDHNWSLALAPRQSIHAPFWFRLNSTALVDILQEPEPEAASYENKGTMMRQRRLVREWFLLPGFLYRWKRIYGLYPKPDSWIWDWYPNGQEWKQSVLFLSSSTAGQLLQQQLQPNEALFPLWWLATPE